MKSRTAGKTYAIAGLVLLGSAGYIAAMQAYPDTVPGIVQKSEPASPTPTNSPSPSATPSDLVDQTVSLIASEILLDIDPPELTDTSLVNAPAEAATSADTTANSYSDAF